MPDRWKRLTAALAAGLALSAQPPAEFRFVRLEYTDFFGARRGPFRGWWRQDWPEAEQHFTQGLRRLTRIDTGEPVHFGLLDDRVFTHPWIYATQTGYWNLSDAECARLREYLLRGGFLVTDDFHGPPEWAVFRDAMERVFPGQPILDLAPDHPMLRVLYEIRERTQIPGLRHLRRGPGGGIAVQMEYTPPIWRTLVDPKGRIVVAANFNQDVGDAWEHADMPEYPEAMTALAYRFGINYIIYAMTH
jgi:hypothetical protein